MPKSLPDPDATWTLEDARRVLAAWRRTKQPLGTFARKNGIGANRLYWWQKRLSGHVASIEFVPAVVANEDEGAVVVVRVAEKVTIEIARASPRMLAELINQLTRTSS